MSYKIPPPLTLSRLLIGVADGAETRQHIAELYVDSRLRLCDGCRVKNIAAKFCARVSIRRPRDAVGNGEAVDADFMSAAGVLVDGARPMLDRRHDHRYIDAAERLNKAVAYAEERKAILKTRRRIFTIVGLQASSPTRTRKRNAIVLSS